MKSLVGGLLTQPGNGGDGREGGLGWEWWTGEGKESKDWEDAGPAVQTLETGKNPAEKKWETLLPGRGLGDKNRQHPLLIWGGGLQEVFPM